MVIRQRYPLPWQPLLGASGRRNYSKNSSPLSAVCVVCIWIHYEAHKQLHFIGNQLRLLLIERRSLHSPRFAKLHPKLMMLEEDCEYSIQHGRSTENFLDQLHHSYQPNKPTCWHLARTLRTGLVAERWFAFAAIQRRCESLYRPAA